MSNAMADSSPPTLARFVDGDHSLQKLIEFPDVDDDVAAFVYCEATVLGSGKIRRNHCFPNENVDPSFPKAVSAAAKLAKLTPATVDGDNRFVYLYYRVLFIQKDGAAEIHVYPNWGADVDKYGLSYEAPQCYHFSPIRKPCSPLFIEFAHVTTVIGTDGTVKGDVTIELGDTNSMNWCENTIRSAFKSSKYIPGHHDGQPVDATYVEMWWHD
jgi:hypothetical protein